jgi:hypothetical protein
VFILAIQSLITRSIIFFLADVHACMSHNWHLCVCLSAALLRPVGAQVGGIRRIVVPVELGYPNNDYKKQGPKPTTFSVSLSPVVVQHNALHASNPYCQQGATCRDSCCVMKGMGGRATAHCTEQLTWTYVLQQTGSGHTLQPVDV